MCKPFVVLNVVFPFRVVLEPPSRLYHTYKALAEVKFKGRLILVMYVAFDGFTMDSEGRNPFVVASWKEKQGVPL